MGVCRVHGYGADFASYVDTANHETMVVLQVENIDAVESIEEICAVPGIDALFIGPYDLSGSMGLMGQVRHPDVESAVKHVLDVAISHDITPGLLISDPAPGEIGERINEGFRLISIGLDTMMLVNAAQRLMTRWREAKYRSG